MAGMNGELRNMLLAMEQGKKNDPRVQYQEMRALVTSLWQKVNGDPIELGVDNNGVSRSQSAGLSLEQSINNANAQWINWWLPLTLADDDVSAINCQALATISGVKYLYVGGTFARIGGVTASNIARYSFETRQWEAVGGGLNGRVYAIAVDGSGNLYAGGSFTDAGGVAAADGIAKWNGSAWSALGGGISTTVYAIAIDSSGNVYAGGGFTDVGGVAAADRIAKWNGSAWSALGSGISNNFVFAIAIDSSDNVYAGGSFTDAGGVAAADGIAKWNGSAWSALGSGISTSVSAIAFDSSGNVYAGGMFTDAGGVAAADGIAKWNGSAWSALGSGISTSVYAIAFDSSGNVYAGGFFADAGGVAEADGIAYFDGQAWNALTNGGGISGLGGYVYSIVVDSDTNTVYAAGDFDTAGTIKTASIAAFVRPLADAIDIIAGLFEQYQARGDAKYALTANGVTNGDSHDHNGGDGAQIAHGNLSSIGTNTHAQIDTFIGTTAPATYAPIANGVTNGDAHNHSGGDGGTINHAALSNIGTNDHSAIDTHLALARWVSIQKNTDESRQSNTTLTNDTNLTVTLTASKKYAFRGRVWFDTPAAADFKYRVAFAGTTLYTKHTFYPAGSSTGTTAIAATSPADGVVLGTGTTAGYVEFEGIAIVDGSNRALNFQWAQNTSTASNTTVKAGSYMEYLLMG